MEINKEDIQKKIAMYEEAAIRLTNEAIANRGAAEGLKNILKELEDKEKAPKDKEPKPKE